MARHGAHRGKSNQRTLPSQASPTAQQRAFGQQGLAKRNPGTFMEKHGLRLAQSMVRQQGGLRSASAPVRRFYIKQVGKTAKRSAKARGGGPR